MSQVQDDPTEPERDDDAIWRLTGGRWRCTAHQRSNCLRCKFKVDPPSFGGTEGDTWSANETLSATGVQTTAGLACPRCGGTQFTAKRSLNGIMLAGIFAPKSQVKCVTCGRMFKRG